MKAEQETIAVDKQDLREACGSIYDSNSLAAIKQVGHAILNEAAKSLVESSLIREGSDRKLIQDKLRYEGMRDMLANLVEYITKEGKRDIRG